MAGQYSLHSASFLQALAQLSDADMVYLRGVLVSAFEAGTIPREGPMFLVLSRLLKLTPQEMARIAMRGGSGGAAGGSGMLTSSNHPNHLNQPQGLSGLMASALGGLSFTRGSFTGPVGGGLGAGGISGGRG